MAMTSPVSGTNVFIGGSSIAGMAGAAACFRHARNAESQLICLQPSQVGTIDMSRWAPDSKIGIIGLAVNNEAQTLGSQLTVDFVKKICNLGHTIHFIADTQGKKAWEDVLVQCGLDKEKLTIQPQDKGEEYGNSCVILQKKLGKIMDSHTQMLLDTGDKADQMNYETPLGKIFNHSTKLAVADNERRAYVAKHMAQSETPDEKIQGWMNEYAEAEGNLPKILESGQDLGYGVFLYDGAIGPHDATAIFAAAYGKKDRIVVLSGANITIKGQPQTGLIIAKNGKDPSVKELDLLDIIKKAGIGSYGAPFRASCALKDKDGAVAAICAAAQLLKQ